MCKNFSRNNIAEHSKIAPKIINVFAIPKNCAIEPAIKLLMEVAPIKHIEYKLIILPLLSSSSIDCKSVLSDVIAEVNPRPAKNIIMQLKNV